MCCCCVCVCQARELENIVEEHCYNGNFMRTDDDDDYDDEIECALLQLDLTVLSVDLPEIQEVDTLAIAKNKALLAAQLADGPCLVEDTSLCFHALGGMPGPYIKWFQQTLKSNGTYTRYTRRPHAAVVVLRLEKRSHESTTHHHVFLFVCVCHQVCTISSPPIRTSLPLPYVLSRSLPESTPIPCCSRENATAASWHQNRAKALAGTAFSSQTNPIDPFRK